jgi:hypothetical protein
MTAREAGSNEDRPSGRRPAIYWCWAFLLRKRHRVAHRAAQCCNDRLRRGHHSHRFVSGPLLDGQGPVRTHGSIAPDRPACSGDHKGGRSEKKMSPAIATASPGPPRLLSFEASSRCPSCLSERRRTARRTPIAQGSLAKVCPFLLSKFFYSF